VAPRIEQRSATFTQMGGKFFKLPVHAGCTAH
jgi:hypothetical protein